MSARSKSSGSSARSRSDATIPACTSSVPFARHDHMWVRRQIFEISTLDADTVTAGGTAQPEAQRALALSADRIALSSDITFPYLINPDIAWKVFSDISPAYEAWLLIPAARAAISEATVQFTWQDAVTTKRAELETRIHAAFKESSKKTSSLPALRPEQAAKTFVLMPIQMRRIAPPRALLAAEFGSVGRRGEPRTPGGPYSDCRKGGGAARQ